ncbi:hypothetical protein NUW54_g2814 [Trametes sanguinea]|uniref:Uncharacterized protein n=1 Tax=Trametes sanguinea TaxID=158606 RepID=A0ACC1Q5B9_9APHY|nr:hypothetical protein NUW54_g2814 [Trametes sanguinea]
MALPSITPFFLFVAFLLLFLVSLSLPIIKSIFLFQLAADASASFLDSSASGEVRFGVWGYCISAITVEVIGIDHETAGKCSSPHLGYQFDSDVANALHVEDLTNVISRALSAVLVLHPIAGAMRCGLHSEPLSPSGAPSLATAQVFALSDGASGGNNRPTGDTTIESSWFQRNISGRLLLRRQYQSDSQADDDTRYPDVSLSDPVPSYGIRHFQIQLSTPTVRRELESLLLNVCHMHPSQAAATISCQAHLPISQRSVRTPTFPELPKPARISISILNDLRERITLAREQADGTRYPAPDTFDPFRFARMREGGVEAATKHQLVNTSVDFLTFSHGKHACPGRFFAANELKTMLAYLVLNYDVRFEEEGKRPANLRFGPADLPAPNATVLFRKRRDAPRVP